MVKIDGKKKAVRKKKSFGLLIFYYASTGSPEGIEGSEGSS